MMHAKPLRIWAYHDRWIPYGVAMSVLPECRTPQEMRAMRRAAKKAQRRARRKGKR